MTAATFMHSYGKADRFQEVLGQLFNDPYYKVIRFISPVEMMLMFGFPLSMVYVLFTVIELNPTAETNFTWWAALGNSIPVPILRFALAKRFPTQSAGCWFHSYQAAVADASS